MKKKFYKRPLYIILFIAIILALSGAIFYWSTTSQQSPYDITLVKRGAVVQEVSVTGRVTPAQDVNLAFERSGKLASAKVKVGETVLAGQILATLENADLVAQVDQAKASLASQQANLDALKRGTRPEEIQIAQTSVSNAQKVLADAQTNLTNVKNQADANLRQVYDGALSAAVKSVAVSVNSLYVVTDIQYVHFMGGDQDSGSLASAKKAAVLVLLGKDDAGFWSNVALGQLSGGAKALVLATQTNPIYANIDQALSEVDRSLEAVRATIDAIPVISDLTSSERTNINTEKTNINTEIIAINGKQEAIRVQKTTNDYNINVAETSVNTAKNSLVAAQDQLNLKLAGSTADSINAQAALVLSAKASVESAQAQLTKTIIKSPIDGVVTKQDGKVGEIISANVSIISVISSANFEIDANVPEADIAKVKAGDSARVTLDTYGSDVFFDTRVVSIDPAETIVEGVATYKVTLQFIENDERVKSGMTANIDILTDKKENVILVPSRLIIVKSSGERFVKVLQSDNQTASEVRVEVGLRGSDGNTEIISDLKEGDRLASEIKK